MPVEALVPELAAGTPADLGLVALLARMFELILGPEEIFLAVRPLAVALVGAGLPLHLVVAEFSLGAVGRGGQHTAAEAQTVGEFADDLGGRLLFLACAGALHGGVGRDVGHVDDRGRGGSGARAVGEDLGVAHDGGVGGHFQR